MSKLIIKNTNKIIIKNNSVKVFTKVFDTFKIKSVGVCKPFVFLSFLNAITFFYKQVIYVNTTISNKIIKTRNTNSLGLVHNGFPIIPMFLNIQNEWLIKLIDFFHLWPISQWVSSLIGLVLMYWFAIKYYNKRLIKHKNEMSNSFMFWMIASDLLINLAVGLYYMEYRNTILGALTCQCPIAFSPFIFIIEFLIVILIKEYEIYSQNNQKNKKKQI